MRTYEWMPNRDDGDINDYRGAGGYGDFNRDMTKPRKEIAQVEYNPDLWPSCDPSNAQVQPNGDILWVLAVPGFGAMTLRCHEGEFKGLANFTDLEIYRGNL